MPDVSIIPVSTRSQRRQFLQLPWKLYRDDPYWVPPLRTNQKELVGFKRHPFYDHAEAQTFLAMRGNEPVGRILALSNGVYNERYNCRQGFFGFFETINDTQAAHGLLDAARDWLRERNHVGLRGPVNPSLNYECGLLVDGFDDPPTFMMTYNPQFYGDLLESYGLQKIQDMYAFWGHVNMLSSLDEKLEFVVREATKRFEITLRPIDRKNFRDEVRMFLDIYNQSLGGTWGFSPLTPREIDHASASMRHLIVPEMTSVAEVDGRPVAAAFGLLDYNPRIKEIDGRLFPFGFLKLMRNRQGLKKIRLISTNVLPEYQRWGLGVVILSHLVPTALEWGIQEAEFSWVLESNHLSFKSLKRGGAKLIKTYRLYDDEAGSQQ